MGGEGEVIARQLRDLREAGVVALKLLRISTAECLPMADTPLRPSRTGVLGQPLRPAPRHRLTCSAPTCHVCARWRKPGMAQQVSGRDPRRALAIVWKEPAMDFGSPPRNLEGAGMIFYEGLDRGAP